jgi:hypothetical protein
MGSKWFTGGVAAAPRGRIQVDFIVNGIRYRPSIKRPPSEANLRRARERLESIKQQIRWEYSPSKKGSPTISYCVAWAARRVLDYATTSSMPIWRIARRDFAGMT